MEERRLLVSSTTNTIKLADSIVRSVMDGDYPSMIAMGKDAMNQMTKALARARSSLATRGIDLIWYSYFEDQAGKTDGATLSAIVTKTEARESK